LTDIKAIECDRCKKIIDAKAEISYINTIGKLKFVFDRKLAAKEWSEYDLCPDCCRLLHDFLRFPVGDFEKLAKKLAEEEAHMQGMITEEEAHMQGMVTQEEYRALEKQRIRDMREEEVEKEEKRTIARLKAHQKQRLIEDAAALGFKLVEGEANEK
jgi:hypothetical protein